MFKNYYHELGKLGVYNISTRQVMLDFKGLVSDEYMPNFTMTHEGVHVVLGIETEFGQVTDNLFKIQKELTYSDEEKKKILEEFYSAQNFVQEGFATLIPFSILKDRIGKDNAKIWADKNIANTDRTPYRDYLNRLYFVTEMELEKRNNFYSKISALAMETGFRIEAPGEDLLESSEKIIKYLREENNNPDKRLEKLIRSIAADSSLLDKTLPEIAAIVKIPYAQANRKQIAEFLTYLLTKTPNPIEYKEDYVGERPPEGKNTLKETYESMVVANLNLDFTNTSEILPRPDDFLFMADAMKVIFVHKINEKITDINFLKSQASEEPEIGVIGFLPSAEKYMIFVNRNTAEQIVNKLNNLTFVIGFEDYDVINSKVEWSSNIRKPDLIRYSFPRQMKEEMKHLIENNPKVRFQHLHSQFMENNPLQTLFVNVKSENPIHFVNHFGNKEISEVLSIIKLRSEVMERRYIEKNRDSINNLLAFWMGQHWEVDWVSNMFNKTKLFFRNGTTLPI